MRRLVSLCWVLGACAPAEPGVHVAQVVGGTATTADPSVVAVFLEDSQGGIAGLCSGTLISRRVVLTAAHCVEGIPRHEVYFGNKSDGGDIAFIAQIPVLVAVAHPRWFGTGLTEGFDVGLLLLAQAAPVEPLPIRHAPLVAADDVGRAVRLVGFGNTTIDLGAGRKREAATAVNDVSERLLFYGDAVANTCQGDSGGPVFIEQDGVEEVAAIVSFGPAGCMEYGAGPRVDVFATDFIDPWIAKMDAPGCAVSDGACTAGCTPPDVDCPLRTTGEACLIAAHCASQLCLPAPDDGAIKYCSQLCAGDAECPSTMTCADASGGLKVCAYPRPTPGALGAACAGDLDCESLACLELDGERVCRRFCRAESDCGAGFVCEDSLEGQLCLPESPVTDCGCRAGGSGVAGGGPAPVLMMLLLALLALRRRAA